MMKKILTKVIILGLVISLIICGCVHIHLNRKNMENKEMVFSGLDDEKLQDYMIENLHTGLNANFTNDDYIIQDITTTYVSKEYIEELSYNSKSNVYFGYTLDELADKFEGRKYIFQVGENNETTVAEFEEYQDYYGRMIKNLAIGSGVILVCTTVSIVCGGTLGIIFAASAKTAAELAVSSMSITGLISSAVEYYKTGDVRKSIEKGALDGTESFKWGAIIGSITGGVTETVTQVNAARQLKTMNYSEYGARAESRAKMKYGGRDQVSYLNGKEVPFSEIGSTRPDLVREVNGKIEAIEVKNYNLDSYWARENLYKELNRQVTDRVNNLPKGSMQRIVLDVQGRNYSKSRIKEVISRIKDVCNHSYANIPVDIMT